MDRIWDSGSHDRRSIRLGRTIPMKILVASDSFKGSLSSLEVARAVCQGVLDILPDSQVRLFNVADGGEGLVESLTDALGGEIIKVSVSDPLFRPVCAAYGIKDGVAIMEMAASSGLPLLKAEERNPSLTTTYGVGEMILDALGRGCRKFLVGIGGSATTDCGMGMLSALGCKFFSADGQLLKGIGADMALVASVDASGMDSRLSESEFTVACDVSNPLYGTDGAAYVFGPQKGADPEMVRALDNGLRNISTYMPEGVAEFPGAGAAGGLGAAFKAFLGARLQPGIEMVLDAIGFDDALAGVDLVITGEGKMDFQTASGKTAAGVLKRSSAAGVPVAALAGKVEMCPELEAMGFRSITQVTPEGCPLEEAMRKDVATENVRKAAAKVISTCSR